jgi:hypothetical protein
VRVLHQIQTDGGDAGHLPHQSESGENFLTIKMTDYQSFLWYTYEEQCMHPIDIDVL